MKFQKVLLMALLSVGAKNVAMDNIGSSLDSGRTSPETGNHPRGPRDLAGPSFGFFQGLLAGTSAATELSSTDAVPRTYARPVVRGAFVPGGSKKTTLCRYPANCFGFNVVKQQVGLPAKPDTDPEIADAHNRIATPVRQIIAGHLSNPNLIQEARVIFATDGSLPRQSVSYENFTKVVKESAVDAIIMAPRGSLTPDQLQFLDHSLRQAITYPFSHVPSASAAATEN